MEIIKIVLCSSFGSIHLFLAVDIGFQLIDVGANNSMNFFSTFEEDECWHCLDIVFLRHSFGLINIDFEEYDGILEFTWTPIFDLRCDTQAWATPPKKRHEQNDLCLRYACTVAYVAKKSTTINLLLFLASSACSSSRVVIVWTIVDGFASKID